MKRIAAALLAVLMVGSVPMPVFAADSTPSAVTVEAKALESVIKSVKSRVSIPSDLDKFKYDTDTKYGVTYYSLTWYKERTVKYSWGTDTETVKSVTVRCHKDIIIYVNVRDNERKDRTGFAKLTDTQAESRAAKYVREIYPGLKGEPVLERVRSTSALRSSDITYNITRPVSGIEFCENGGRITIDKDTGALVKYELVWWNDALFPDASKRLSEEAVSEIYRSRKPLKASYRLFTKYEYNRETEEDERTVFVLPVYTPSVSGENEIDAITGEYTALYDDKEKYSYTDAYEWEEYDLVEEVTEEAMEEEADVDNMALSPAELAAVADESKYLSYEKCLEQIKKDPFIVFDSVLVNKSNRVGEYTDIKGEVKPLRMLRFEFSSSDEKKDSIRLDVDMDAVTGEIVRFSKRYTYGKNSPNRNTKGADDDAVLKRANEAAKHFMGSKAAEYRPGSKPYVYKSKDYTATDGTVGYTRYVNGLPADFDSMAICVDSRGEVLNFSYTYHDLEFPEPKLVGEDAAYSKLFEKMKPDLYYTGFADLQLKPHIYLTYRFDADYTINALTGERINTWDASAYYTDNPERKEKVIAYTDISGYKYEKEIKTLLDYGIYVTDSDRLAPDEAITNGEFAQLFDSVCGTNISRIYSDIWNGKEYVKNPEKDKKLTRGEIAKIYVWLYADEYSDAAVVKGIYKAPFTDVGSDHGYCGWIVFAKSEGMVKGSGGRFSPDAGITKGDALKTAYDYLANNSDNKKLYEIVTI
ncbi:MAG: S-layer homology domain-containing protein [Oscillospiraceae bacterium]|nr:S-layer homology domain-containing protein [Oscillospiraceae bacterium]